MIAVFIEERQGKIKKSALEALVAGKSLAGEMGQDVQAVFVGHNLGELPQEALRYGADKVVVLDNPLFNAYSASGFAQALSEYSRENTPDIWLFSATSMGKDLVPRLAAKLGVGLASDCTQAEIVEGALQVVRPIYAGKALATFRFKSSPAIASLRPNVFQPGEPVEGSGDVEIKEMAVTADRIKASVDEVLKEEGAELDVTEADIIVSGGRGLKGPENFALLKELASILPHAAVGASRSAVDSGWIDHQHQVGQTGKTVSPSLYMAFGLSGAIQHMAGMSSSKVIVAVNKDPEAPILKVADFGIVGDLFEVIPPLKEELEKILAD